MLQCLLNISRKKFGGKKRHGVIIKKEEREKKNPPPPQKKREKRRKKKKREKERERERERERGAPPPRLSRRGERRGRGEHAAASFNSVPLRSSAAKNAGCFSCLFLPSGLPARRIDCCCLVRELKKGPPLFSMLASVSVYPLPHFFSSLSFLPCLSEWFDACHGFFWCFSSSSALAGHTHDLLP